MDSREEQRSAEEERGEGRERSRSWIQLFSHSGSGSRSSIKNHGEAVYLAAAASFFAWVAASPSTLALTNMEMAAVAASAPLTSKAAVYSLFSCAMNRNTSASAAGPHCARRIVADPVVTKPITPAHTTAVANQTLWLNVFVQRLLNKPALRITSNNNKRQGTEATTS